MNNTNKEFDAVAMMRQIRDQLSQQFQNWTLEEQQQYIRSHINVPKQEIFSCAKVSASSSRNVGA